MRLSIKILIILIITLVIAYIGIYAFLLFAGKGIFIRALEDITGKKVDIGYLDMAPPLNFEIKNLSIRDTLTMDSAYISISMPGFLTGNMVFNTIKLTRPQFKFERAQQELTDLALTLVKPKETNASALNSQANVEAVKQSKILLPLICKRVIIKDGSLDFFDQTVGEEGIKIVVRQIEVNFTNLYFLPRPGISDFSISGRIPWEEGAQEEEGRIEISGWLNFFKKDMQATLKIEDINGIYLYPYYSTWVDLERARIEKAKLNFISDIQGLNNDVTANCRLELTDIVRRPLAAEDAEDKAAKITDAVLDIFKALNQGKIVLDFTIKTKMDRPEFGFKDIKMAFESKLASGRKGTGFDVQDILGFPTKLLGETVKGATDLSRAVISGTISLGSEIKNALEASFRREANIEYTIIDKEESQEEKKE